MHFTLDQFKEFTEAVFSRLDDLDKRLTELQSKVQEPELEDINFSIPELAKYLNCHVQTVMKQKRSGLLPFYQTGRKVFFKKSEIDKIAKVSNLGKKR